MCEFVQCFGDAGAAYAHHQRQKFVSQGQLVGRHAVVCHQEPPCQPLRQGCSGIGNSRVCRLNHKSLYVSEEQRSQGTALAHGVAEIAGGDAHAAAGDLHVGGVWGLLVPEMTANPLIPSHPITPTSTSAPPGLIATTDATPVSGK